MTFAGPVGFAYPIYSKVRLRKSIGGRYFRFAKISDLVMPVCVNMIWYNTL